MCSNQEPTPAELARATLGDIPLSFFRSDTSQRIRAMGRTEASILKVLEKREIEVTADARAVLGSCTDLDLLQLWFDRALTVSSTAEMFDRSLELTLEQRFSGSHTGQRLRDQGRSDVRAPGLILHILDIRGVPISAESRVRLASCLDPEQLEIWLVRALTATTTTDVFE